MTTTLESSDKCIVVNGVIYPKGVLRARLTGNRLTVWEDLERTIPLISSVSYADIVHQNTEAPFASLQELADFVKQHFFFKTISSVSELINDTGFVTATYVTNAITGMPGYIQNQNSAAQAATAWITGDFKAKDFYGDRIAIGTTTPTASGLTISGNLTGGTNVIGTWSNGSVQSDATNAAYYNRTNASTQAASFTLSNLYHYAAFQSALGAGSAVTNQYGIYIDLSLTGAANNFGFYGAIPSGTGRYNLYMAGTAANYLGGTLTLGSVGNATGDILTRNSSTGLVTLRTAAQLLSDIGALTATDARYIRYDTTQALTEAQKARSLINVGGYSTTDATAGLDLDTEVRPYINQYSSSANWTNKPATGYWMVQTVRSASAPTQQGYQFALENHSDSGFYFRTLDNVGWNSWHRLWHNGDFTSTNIANWNTAYGWGNHAANLYMRETFNLASDASKTFGSIRGIGYYTNSVGSTNYPTSVGLAVEFSSGLGNNVSSYNRDFTLYHSSGLEDWHLRSYSDITGASNTFRRIWHSGDFTSSDITNWNTAYANNHLPLTIGTANGLSLATQTLSLALASTSVTGALSSTDWNTFNDKAPATGAAGYIWNGTAAQTADFNISGTGTIGTSLTSPIIHGGAGSGGNLTLSSTSSASKGKIYFGASNNDYYDEFNRSITLQGYNTLSASTIGGMLLSKGGPIAVQTENTGDVFLGNYHGLGAPTIRLQKGNGTVASPSQVLNNHLISSISSAAYNAGTSNYMGGTVMQSKATENHSSTALGTNLQIGTTLNGTTVPSTKFIFDHDGALLINSPTNVTNNGTDKLQVTGSANISSIPSASSATSFLTANGGQIQSRTTAQVLNDIGGQQALSGTGLVKSTAGAISYITDNSADWDTAYGWGDFKDYGMATGVENNAPETVDALTFTNTELRRVAFGAANLPEVANGYLLRIVGSNSPAGVFKKVIFYSDGGSTYENILSDVYSSSWLGWRKLVFDDEVAKRTVGVASGDGVTTAITVTLPASATWVMVGSKSNHSGGIWNWDVSGTTLTIRHNVPPPSGTNNLEYWISYK